MPIIDKYNKRSDAINSLLCVGLDPDVAKLPERFKNVEHPQFEFNKSIIDQTHEYAAAFKPNTAFYEARGSEGMKELEMTCAYLQQEHPDIFTVIDAKRADIGNTNNGSATFVFDRLAADSITVNPFLGRESLEPFLARKDKGTIVLSFTSNPGSQEFQGLSVEGRPLWQVITEIVAKEWNANDNCMFAVGATHPDEFKILRALVGEMTLLVPGVGAQGGDVQTVVATGKNANGKGLIINASRSIIFSEDPREAARSLRDEINSYR